MFVVFPLGPNNVFTPPYSIYSTYSKRGRKALEKSSRRPLLMRCGAEKRSKKRGHQTFSSTACLEILLPPLLNWLLLIPPTPIRNSLLFPRGGWGGRKKLGLFLIIIFPWGIFWPTTTYKWGEWVMWDPLPGLLTWVVYNAMLSLRVHRRLLKWPWPFQKPCLFEIKTSSQGLFRFLHSRAFL